MVSLVTTSHILMVERAVVELYAREGVVEVKKKVKKSNSLIFADCSNWESRRGEKVKH
jgi:hypothetical protein